MCVRKQCAGVLYHVWGRREGTWSVVGFLVWGSPAGWVSHVYQPVSSGKSVGSQSSDAPLHISQRFYQSEPNTERTQRKELSLNTETGELLLISG